jgi:hypothetical protein
VGDGRLWSGEAAADLEGALAAAPIMFLDQQLRGGGADSQSREPVNLNPCSWGYLRNQWLGTAAVAGAGSLVRLGLSTQPPVAHLQYRDGLETTLAKGDGRKKSLLFPVGE